MQRPCNNNCYYNNNNCYYYNCCNNNCYYYNCYYNNCYYYKVFGCMASEDEARRISGGNSSISHMPGCGPNALPKNWI